MLRSIKELVGYKLIAPDGEIGRCKDFLFDEKYWSVRYMVAETGSWFSSNRILIAPDMFGEPDWSTKTFPVLMSGQDLNDAPHPADHEPISRLHEKRWLSHFGRQFYWLAGGYASGNIDALPPDTELLELPQSNKTEIEAEEGDDKVHLRSVIELEGYTVWARDEEAGKVDDYIIDDTSWIIRHLAVNTGFSLLGKRVLVFPARVTEISWARHCLVLNISLDTLTQHPAYDPSQPVNREYQEVMYDYEGRPHA
jgi:uncharacterized protein YrrD